VKKLFVLLLFLGGLSTLSFAYPRSGNMADPSFLDAGNTAFALSVALSSTSATQVYSTTTTAVVDREVLIQMPVPIIMFGV